MSENDGLNLRTAAFDAAVLRLATTSKRAAVDVMKQQARLLFVQVAKITPPNHDGVTGRKAEEAGKKAVAADIYSVYGTRGDAYAAVEEKLGEAAAGSFWRHLGAGNVPLANAILSEATGKRMYDFDGGTLHSRVSFKTRRRATRRQMFFVLNSEDLAAYVAEEQTHVWWLASGWQDALKALGAKPPFGADKHGSAPGRLRVEVTDQRIVIAMENRVKYGREVRDIERRINAALNYRTGTLDRQWEYYLNRAAKDAGFVQSLKA